MGVILPLTDIGLSPQPSFFVGIALLVLLVPLGWGIFLFYSRRSSLAIAQRNVTYTIIGGVSGIIVCIVDLLEVMKVVPVPCFVVNWCANLMSAVTEEKLIPNPYPVDVGKKLWKSSDPRQSLPAIIQSSAPYCDFDSTPLGQSNFSLQVAAFADNHKQLPSTVYEKQQNVNSANRSIVQELDGHERGESNATGYDSQDSYGSGFPISPIKPDQAKSASRQEESRNTDEAGTDKAGPSDTFRFPGGVPRKSAMELQWKGSFKSERSSVTEGRDVNDTHNGCWDGTLEDAKPLDENYLNRQRDIRKYYIQRAAWAYMALLLLCQIVITATTKKVTVWPVVAYVCVNAYLEYVPNLTWSLALQRTYIANIFPRQYWNIMFMVLSGYGLFFMPLVQSWKDERRTKQSKESLKINIESFVQMLNDQNLFEEFKKYTAKELCVENAIFIEEYNRLMWEIRMSSINIPSNQTLNVAQPEKNRRPSSSTSLSRLKDSPTSLPIGGVSEVSKGNQDARSPLLHSQGGTPFHGQATPTLDSVRKVWLSSPIRNIALAEQLHPEKRGQQCPPDVVPKSLVEKFLKLVSIFIKKNAPLELNISSATREQIFETIQTFQESQIQSGLTLFTPMRKETITRRWLSILKIRRTDNNEKQRPEDLSLPLSTNQNASASAPSTSLNIRNPAIMGAPQYLMGKESSIDSASLNLAVAGTTTSNTCTAMVPRKSADTSLLPVTLFDKALDEVLDLLFYNIFPHWILSRASVENVDQK
ncbi:hypothetical protein BJ742DRAFT_907335 [Cladochytrium replicatum]|nr:hypothetical protein BJ742DRAFT_907335 [Cladochytrium replicatum]